MIDKNDRTTIIDVRKAMESLDRKRVPRPGSSARQSAGPHGKGYDISSESLRQVEEMLTKIAGVRIRLYAVLSGGTASPEFAVRLEGCFAGPATGPESPRGCRSPQCRLWANIIQRVISRTFGGEAVVRITACGVKGSRDFFASDDVGPSENPSMAGPKPPREDGGNGMRSCGTTNRARFEEQSSGNDFSPLVDTYLRALPPPP